MNILTISNLFPRPDRPRLGMFNQQLFRGFTQILGAGHVDNLCLVPEWRAWRWAGIRKWRPPEAVGVPTRYVPAGYFPVVGRDWSGRLYARALMTENSLFEAADAVYAAWLYPDGVAAVRVAAIAGKPAWIMVQGSDTFHLRSTCRRRAILDACREAAGLVCVSAGLAERLIDAGVDQAKVHVVPNGVDAERFRYRDRAEAREQLKWQASGVGAADPVALFVGNLFPVKAPDLFVRTAAMLKQQPVTSNPGLRFVMLGDGPMRKRLQRLARELGINDRVVFAGSRPHDEIAWWLNAADVLCLTSRSEGMPNVVREALASGLPVVATDVGACRDMLADEPHACVVPSGDASGIAKAIVDVLSKPVDRSSLSLRHRDWSWTDQARRILQLMEIRQ
jgi:teichuronic acid biosynthesis glycosyltransferase TuaC